jgi:excisionase family DNA binding protein
MTSKTQIDSPTLYVQHWSPRPTLSINETAAALGCSRSHIYNEVRSGRLVARQTRGRTIVLTSDFDNYLKSLPTLPSQVA